MMGSGRSRVGLLAVGAALLCLAGQAVAVAPVQADATVAAAPVMVSSAPAGTDDVTAAPTPRGGTPWFILWEDFDEPWPSPGWATFDKNGAVTGGEVYWETDDFKAYYGDRSAYAARGGANGVDPELSQYPANMDSWMVYGPFSLSGFIGAKLYFAYWNQSELNHDPFCWGASGNGTDFAGMSCVSGNSAGWESRDLDLAAFLGDTSVWIGFNFTSDSGGSSVGPFVDPVIVMAETPSAPLAFPKKGPANNAVGQPLNPTLSWWWTSGADSFEYCIDTINDAACSGAWVGTGTQDAVSLWALSPSTTYYWQVRAKNTYGTTYADGGTWWSFTTGDAPTPFGKVSPANGAAGRPTTLTLSWGQSAGANEYQYCIDTNPNPVCDDAWYLPDGGDLGLSVSKSGLALRTTYYWQVRAISDTGFTYANGESGWWSFRTEGDPPGAFSKDVPANGASGQSLSPTLSWQPSPAADSYQLCIDTTNDGICGSQWSVAGSGTTMTVPGLLPGTSYYWTVLAVNSYGVTQANGGAWWSFITGSPTLLQGSFRSEGAFDGWVRELEEDAGKGGLVEAGAATLRVGDDASDRQFRAILDFDTSSLPDEAVVTGVTLRVKRQGVTGRNPILTHGYLKVDMRSGFFHDVEALERFDFQAPASRGNVGRFIRVMDPGDWYRAPLRAPSYGLVNLVGVTQFRLRFDLDDNDDSGADFLSLFSGEPANDADRPELIITYYVP